MPTFVPPTFHWYVYEPVPPVGLTLSAIVWPLSIVGDNGEIEPAETGELTVTVSVEESAVGVGVAGEVVPVSVTM